MSTQGALEHEGEFLHSIQRAQKGIKRGGSFLLSSFLKFFLDIIPTKTKGLGFSPFLDLTIK